MHTSSKLPVKQPTGLYGRARKMPPIILYKQSKNTDERAVDEVFDYLYNKFIRLQNDKSQGVSIYK